MAEAPMKKSRFFKRALVGLAAIPLVLAGAALFLRSAPGERFLFARLTSILAAQGFQIEAEEFAGKLPGRLYLRGLKISDADGLIATVGEAELLLRWQDIFERLAHIERLEIKNPEIWRLPKPPEKAQEETDEKLSLPGALRVDKVMIQGGTLHEKALKNLGFENLPSGFSIAGEGNFGESENFGAAEAMPLTALLFLEVDDVAALSPQLSGSLVTRIMAVGSLADLIVGIDVGSQRISTPNAVLENIDLKLEMAGTPLGSQWQGKADLWVRKSSAGDFQLMTDWQVNTAGGLLAEITGLEGHLGNLYFDGDMAADLRGTEPALNGAISVETVHWNPLNTLVGATLFSGLTTDIALKLATGENGQSLFLDMDAPEFAIQGETGDLLSLSATTAHVKASDIFGAADVEADITLGPGLAGGGRWSGATLKANGSLGSGDFDVDVKGLALSGLGGEARDGLRTAGAYNLNEKSVNIDSFDLRLASSGLTLNSPTRFSFGEIVSLSPASFNIQPTGKLTAEADFRPGQVAVKADVSALPFSFFKIFPGSKTFVPDGAVERLSVKLEQGPDGVAGTADLTAKVQYQNLAPTVNVQATLSGGAQPMLTAVGQIAGGAGWDSAGKLRASLPLRAGANGALPTVNMDAPLNASLDWSGSIEPLWNLAGQPDRKLRGRAAIRAAASGALGKPVPQGTIYLAGARYEDTLLGLLVNDINIEAHSTPDDFLTGVISAKDSRGGSLALTASLARGDKGLELAAKGRLGRFNPLQRDDVSLYLSGDIGAEGPLERPRLTSNLTVDRGELDLRVLLASQSIPTLTIAEGGDAAESSRGPRFDLHVKAPNQFFIRGYGLDTEWRGDLNIGGVAARPSLSGTLAPVRGVFEIFSREFTFNGGNVTFNGGVDPILNLELENSGPNITALIKISGGGSAPSLSMSSRPPQPEEEVLAQVLFGKRASDLSRFEALQLAAGLSELSSFSQEGGFSLDPVGRVRKELGLDVLRVGGAGGTASREISDMSGSLGQDMGGPSGAATGGDVGGATVEAGKYISDKVYAGVEQSASGGSAFRIEMELSPLMSLQARTSTESSQVGVGWKKDY